jgi:UDP-N-acetyl-alpha-D-muramoyl-L-alanyl-L-glutamate epimerase
MAEQFGRDTFEVFRVLPWEIDGARLHLHFGFDRDHRFTETVTFPTPLASSEYVTVERLAPLIDLLALAAGTSYFKAAAPRRIRVETGRPISQATVSAVHALYDDGLRELAFNNGLPIPLETELVAEIGTVTMPAATSGRPLIPCGGGRDSSLLTSVLVADNPYLLSIKPNSYVDRLGEHFGLQVVQARRSIDRHLLDLNSDGAAMNGHIPVTAIYSLVSCVAAALLGCADVVMANERSASVASRTMSNGATVNHQYSKSVQFEALLQAALAGGPRWYSALRPWSELAIARGVTRHGELVPLIMSCNRAFNEYNTKSNGWCLQCDKCRFVFLTLAPFTSPAQLTAAFGADLLADETPSNVEGFAALCRPERPFDCVGEELEGRAALTLLQVSESWNHHAVVTRLGDMFAPASASEIDELLRPDGHHHVPANVFEALDKVLTSAGAQS